MKRILHNISNTINTLKLMSNPEVQKYIQTKFNTSHNFNHSKQMDYKSGKKDLFFHKHFIVQVVH
ncbi:hypothetical protein A3J15_00100 [Candidatus Roizmanbacteria bacterium RIFCSPLOWO2_02_FULL_38_10]|uniref:Uncharacterized protein n=1 Tax=Candidatus Roizmanbacteria bacterium RIFCSPLOWO2_02_FULL_38_10 TaxID=1802074 RepID=A0A1F7JNC7_9BACT|nr:MAG: hypothetical protein A3J15_00100 [Candidatus Roizmanbacteria bacterium RIFCSPLOWO2_02_FULL_38_10]